MTLSREKLVMMLVDEFGLDAAEIEAGAPLFSGGLLDSFNMVELVSYLEDETGTKLAAAEFTLENLDTVDRIVAFMARRASA